MEGKRGGKGYRWEKWGGEVKGEKRGRVGRLKVGKGGGLVVGETGKELVLGKKGRVKGGKRGKGS
jgi:hypothetical protein